MTNTEHPFVTLYQPLGILGSGGQGRVFKVKDRNSDAIYAAKLIGLDSWEEIGKLEREARVLKQLDHPHIPRFVNYHTCTNPISNAPEFILVTQYIEGKNLSQRMGENFPEERLRHVKKQTLDALAHAHERDIVHRDLKPSNIMLTDEDEVYITDFGLAKVLGERTRTNSFGAGTLAYQAPEQLGEIDAPIAPYTDYHALGLVLISLLKGKEREKDITRQKPEEELKNVNSISPSFRQGLEYLVSREPTERHKGMSESQELMPVKARETDVPSLPFLFEELGDKLVETLLSPLEPKENERTGVKAFAFYAMGVSTFLSFYLPHLFPSLVRVFAEDRNSEKENKGAGEKLSPSPAESLGTGLGVLGGVAGAVGQIAIYVSLVNHFGPKVLLIPAATNAYSLIYESVQAYRTGTQKFLSQQKLLPKGKKE